MKIRSSLLLLLMCISLFVFSQPKSTKYLIYTVNGKSGLTNLKGKTVVEPEYEFIQYYNDEFFLGKKEGKFSLVTIGGKSVYTFSEKKARAENLSRGGLLISADSNIYFFSKNLQLVSTIPQVETSDALSHVVILYFQEPKGSGVQCSVNMYDNESFKLLGRYQLLDCDGFDFEKGSRKHKPYFKISHLQNGKPTASIVDTAGKLILSHALPPGSTLNNLEVCINKKGRLFGFDDYPSELVNDYYKGKNIAAEMKNVYLLTKKEIDLETVHWKVYGSDGTLINDFGRSAELDAEEANFRTGEIAYMTLLSKDSVKGESEYFIDNSFQNRGKLITHPYKEENESYSNWEHPKNDNYLLLTESNNQLALFSPIFNKQIAVFTPDPSNVYNSKGMIPVSELLHGAFLMYKENDSYGMYNLFSDKKTPLFNFPLKTKTVIEEVEVNEDRRNLTFEINISLKGANEKTRDTTFYYLLTTKGEFKSLEGEANSLSPWRAFDTLNREQVSFDLDFLCVKTNKKQIKVLNRDGKELLDLKDKMLYCVGTNYLGLSDDGKTSTLFDLKLEQVKKNIPGVVCASIEGPGDLLCFENGVYNRYHSGKVTPLFTENELMGWDKNFVNNPDSDNYQERQMIVHVMKQGNFLVMYQNVPTENSFKMSLYDLQNARLHTCLKQQFLDFTEELSMFPPLYADRFMFASPQEPKVKCFEGIYKPKIKADTLMLALYIPQDQELLGPKLQNAYLFNSKTSSNVYFGTIDSIYYTFKSHPDVNEWDCGIYVFGDPEIGFYLLDTAKNQLSKDKYATLDTDMENSCLYNEFAASNMRTGKRELFRLTDQGHEKLMEGNFQSFTRVQSPKDGFGRSAAFYLFFNDSKLQFVTDDKFKPVFDTTKYAADPEGDYTTLMDNGGNFMVLKGKRSDENYYVVNALTKEITKMKANPQTGYVEHFLVLESRSGSGESVDLLLVETGEVMKNVNLSKGEYFVFNGKLYFQENVENDSSRLYNSAGKRIK